MAFIDFDDAAPQALPVAVPHRIAVSTTRGFSDPLTALERRVVELARQDGLETLQPPRRRGWLARLALGPAPASPTLANERLEALRRLAVQAWHKGYTIPASALDEAQAAGFDEDQIGAVIDSIGRIRASTRRIAA
ncbi:MAG TPA: hypothetical protein VJQ77_06845 [Novosphingobium sp.]|nr:hypothetical protein [Novosphingobium sp.]